MLHRSRVVLLIATAVILLTGCRVDMRVDVVADEDGSGQLVVTTDLDAEAVQLVPGLAEDLQLDDLIASGWKVEGPTQVNNGGLRVRLVYDFESPAEANAALAQINGPNGPLLAPTLKRTVNGRDVATTFDSTLQFVGGLEAFSDAELSSLIGRAPWTTNAEKLGIDPMQSVSFTLVARLPGEIRKTTGTEGEGGVVWSAPLDGSAQSAVLGTMTTKADGGFWATVAKVVGVVFAGWLIVMGLLIMLVMFARRRRGVTAPIRRSAERRETPRS